MDMRRRLGIAGGAAALAVGIVSGIPTMTSAAPPVVVEDDGAFVRIVGNPGDGTIKFQFGWDEGTAASEASGYWVGVYDVTNSHYEWVYDTGPADLGEEFSMNARPMADLADGEYKVVLFVRASYGPEVNIAEIEVPFTVAHADD
jgi:hypothetical protein